MEVSNHNGGSGLNGLDDNVGVLCHVEPNIPNTRAVPAVVVSDRAEIFLSVVVYPVTPSTDTAASQWIEVAAIPVTCKATTPALAVASVITKVAFIPAADS